MPPAGMGAARQRAHGEPASARRFPDTAAGLDASMAHSHARKLPRHTDPDTIEDSDVRDAFLSQLNDDESRPHGATRRGSTGDASPGRGPMLGRTLSMPDSIGSAVAGGLVFAVLINYVRGGPAQVKKWFAAKLTNGQGRLA